MQGVFGPLVAGHVRFLATLSPCGRQASCPCFSRAVVRECEHRCPTGVAPTERFLVDVTHQAIIELSFERPAAARTVEQALALEVGAIDDDRSTTRVDRENATLVVTIDADDPTALRAAKHTWFSLLVAAEATVDAIDEHYADGHES